MRKASSYGDLGELRGRCPQVGIHSLGGAFEIGVFDLKTQRFSLLDHIKTFPTNAAARASIARIRPPPGLKWCVVHYSQGAQGAIDMRWHGSRGLYVPIRALLAEVESPGTEPPFECLVGPKVVRDGRTRVQWISAGALKQLAPYLRRPAGFALVARGQAGLGFYQTCFPVGENDQWYLAPAEDAARLSFLPTGLPARRYSAAEPGAALQRSRRDARQGI